MKKEAEDRKAFSEAAEKRKEEQDSASPGIYPVFRYIHYIIVSVECMYYILMIFCVFIF